MLEAVHVEKLFEQLLPLLVVCLQESSEATLRQDDHLEELRGVHAEEAADLQAHILRPLRQRPPRRAVPALQQRRGVLDHDPVATPLGPGLRRRPGHPEPASTGTELQPHPCRRSSRRVMGAQVVARLVPLPRHHPIKREPEGVEQRRLAAAGVAAEQHQPALADLVEVEPHLARERTKRLKLQQVGAHQSTAASTSSTERAASRASRSSTASRSVGSDRTWDRKLPATSRSVRPRVREA